MLMGGDEAYFALHARSIALTARDVDGRFLPLFFKIDPTTWYQPMLVYLMAPVLKVFGVSEWTVRAPIAAIAVVNVLLMYAVAKRLFGGVRHAVFAALLMAMTPVHVIIGRMAMDYLCPVPFVLGWLWCLLVAMDTGNAWWALGAGGLLALGVFSYIAAWFMMPVYFLLTLAALWWTRDRSRLMLAAAGRISRAAPAVRRMAARPRRRAGHNARPVPIRRLASRVAAEHQGSPALLRHSGTAVPLLALLRSGLFVPRGQSGSGARNA